MITELLFVAAGDFLSLLQNQRHLVEDAQAHCGGKFVEFGVDTDAVDDVGVDNAEVAEQANPFRQGVIIGNDGAALDGVEQLGSVKAERADVAPVEYRLVLVADAERVGAVVDHLQAMPLCNLRDSLNVARIAEDMGGHDRLGVGLYPRFDRLGIQVPGGLVDVREYRPDALPLQRTGGGDETERSCDGAAGEIQCPISDLQRQGPVVGQDDIPDTQVIAQPLLQLSHQRAMIGQPTGCVDAVDVAQEFGFIAQIRFGDIDHLDVLIGRHVG